MATPVTLKTFFPSLYDLDGPLDDLITELENIRAKAKEDHLINVRVDCDWNHPKYGSTDENFIGTVQYGSDEKIWEINIIGDKE